jgi:hypothetical protein
LSRAHSFEHVLGEEPPILARRRPRDLWPRSSRTTRTCSVSSRASQPDRWDSSNRAPPRSLPHECWRRTRLAAHPMPRRRIPGTADRVTLPLAAPSRPTVPRSPLARAPPAVAAPAACRPREKKRRVSADTKDAPRASSLPMIRVQSRRTKVRSVLDRRTYHASLRSRR